MPRSARAQLYVSQLNLGSVSVYDATTGAAINTSFITGLSGPTGLLVAPVPEPSTWSMIAVGGVALLGIMLLKNIESHSHSFSHPFRDWLTKP